VRPKVVFRLNKATTMTTKDMDMITMTIKDTDMDMITMMITKDMDTAKDIKITSRETMTKSMAATML